LTADSLQRTIQLIEGRTGLAVSSLLKADVSYIVARLSHGDMEAWLAELQRSPEDAPVWQRLIAALTIGETYFMRDLQHFRLLRERLLPPLVLKRRQAGEFHLSLLSVGCSTGEEPYSLAIALNEFLPDIDRWRINLVGMDINAAALKQAQQAVYRPWSFRHASETFLRRYFTPKEDGYQLRDEIVQRVAFIRGNLIDPPTLPQFDIIFCRNVLLYFTAWHAHLAEDNLYRLLRPGGWLLLGSAEALRSHRERWQIDVLMQAPIYQKSRRRAPQPSFRLQTEGQPLPALPVELPAVDVSHAEAAILAGDLDHAERLLGQVLMETPHAPHAHTLLAFIFASRRAYPEARAHLDTALRFDPTHSDAYYLRAVMLSEEREPHLAHRELQAALYYQRDHLPALLMMGMFALNAGDIPRAHRIWQRVRGLAQQLAADQRISVLSELTAGQVLNMLANQLES
jgi:chemotaxis protein methyltransferase CheR